MHDPPSEPTILRLSRGASRLLPKGRSVIIRSIARITGCDTPFFAEVGRDRFLIDLSERVSRTLYAYGAFEPTIAAILPFLLAAGDTVVDAGANFGYFSILCARAVAPSGKVYAFDPDPRNIERLLANIRANGLTNIEHVPSGLFDRTGEITFNLATDGEDNLGSSSMVDQGPGRKQIRVPITTLDEFVTGRGLPRIDFMKMDIEGAEVEALAGAQTLLAQRRIGKVLVEMHNMIIGREKAGAVARRFADAGYRGYYIREGGRIPADLAGFLEPIVAARWLDESNPHVLFTAEPIPDAS